ncbi:MAG TPA: HD domain-containing protein [Kofleriaceae bacterium]|nr:HD domain-containing protein [Kofleriaceae bacterium]
MDEADEADEAARLVERARAMALAAHGDQRYGAEPYRVHLEHVEEVVRRYAHTAAMRAAAWLHDAVEDTPLTLAEIAAALGAEVAAIVAAVTDEPGATRAERKPPTLAKLRRASPSARAVKLADRIANLESAHRSGRGDLVAMYRGEHAELTRQLRLEGEHEAQWAALDELIGQG